MKKKLGDLLIGTKYIVRDVSKPAQSKLEEFQIIGYTDSKELVNVYYPPQGGWMEIKELEKYLESIDFIDEIKKNNGLDFNMKYRKKPVIIEAEKISNLLNLAKSDWYKLPDWVRENYEKGYLVFVDGYLSIKTLEGTMRGNKEDYLIQSVNGEIYACKPDIFEKTYEKL